MPDRETILWKLISLGFGAAAGVAAERVVSMVWKLVANHAPPKDTADRRNPWPETIAWAAAVGVGAGVARAVANRSAAVLWEVATNETPPGTTNR